MIPAKRLESYHIRHSRIKDGARIVLNRKDYAVVP